MHVAFDPATFRKVMGHYPTGVCAITATQADGTPVAMVVGSFTSVSLDPPLVGFLPDRSSGTWPRIEACRRFCVNVLGDHQLDLCNRLASRHPDKHSAMTYRMSDQGNPVLNDAVAWIDCEIDSVHEAGDHFFVLGRVKKLDTNRSGEPLLFYKGRYHKVALLD